MKEVHTRACTLVVGNSDTIAESAATLGLHRSTVAEHIDPEKLEMWRKPM